MSVGTCDRCGVPDADPSGLHVRLRVLTDPEIAAAWAKEDAALRAWVRGRNVKELRRLKAAYLEAHRETSKLLRTRPAVDPLAPSAEVPS